jgi:sugar lactone lactonase YvrE
MSQPVKAQNSPLPLRNSELAFTINEKDLIPEGIAYDPVRREFYVGSILKRKIVRIDSSGRASDFTSEGQDGLFKVLGMTVDPKRKTLWVCSAAGNGAKEFDGHAGIFKYDLRTGKLIRKYVLDNTQGPHLFNDIVINADGDAFFTDSKSGGVYTITRSKDAVDLFIEPKTFDYPNGIALSPDEKILFVAAAEGIYRIGLADKKRSPLAAPEGEKIAGLDGMYFYRGSLVGIQNGIEPIRVVRLYLSPAMDNVTRLQVLDSDNRMFQIPTTGAIVGDQLYFIGNSQLTSLQNDGSLDPKAVLQAVRILKVNL